MACQSDYIGLNTTSVSRSGLYASDLPGVEELIYPLLSKDSETNSQVWERIYRNAWNALISDVGHFLQEKYFVNQKLVSRETSEFIPESNFSAELAGVQIYFPLSRYSKLHVVSLSVWSLQEYASPEVTFQFYDTDQDGELLFEKSVTLTEGRNTVFIDQDFEIENLFISYDPTLVELKKTENKYYRSSGGIWSAWEWKFSCFGGTASVRQINDGGINAVFNVYCSVEKFVCQNLNLFARTFWWRIGLEFAQERRLGNRLNQFTTMTDERKKELFDSFNAEYQQALSNSLKAHNIYEDPVCFECMNDVNYKIVLP